MPSPSHTIFSHQQLPSRRSLIAECRRSLRAASPLIAAQLVQMGHGLIDAMVSARLGTAEFAAAGLSASLWFFSSLLCIGLLAGLSPLAAELIGKRKRAQVGGLFRQGMWLALVLGFAACFGFIAIAASLHLFSLQAELIPLIRLHAYAACWSLIPLAFFIACRNICEATQLTRVVFLVSVLGLFINLLGNLGLGLGWFGLPRLGLTGIGLSTTLVSTSMLLTLLFFMRGNSFQRFTLFQHFEWPEFTTLAALLKLSIPLFFALLFEAGLFAATIIQMGMLGTLPAAAHTLAISATSFCYMFPLGLSFVLTARVGQVFGALRNDETGTALYNQRYAPSLRLRIAAGCFLTLLLATLTCLFLLLFREPITALYTDDQQVREFASYLLLLAAIFQFSDAAQATLIGMLRGMQDARVPMFINAFSYWVVAFGLGAFLAHRTALGATGLWIGLICGLSLSAFLLALRVRFLQRRYAPLPG